MTPRRASSASDNRRTWSITFEVVARKEGLQPPDHAVERVLTNRRPVAGLVVTLPTAVLAPGAGAGEWELCRTAPVAGSASPGAAGQGSVTRQVFASLEEAAANLLPAEPFVLALPIELGLVQRLGVSGGRTVRTGGDGTHPTGKNPALPRGRRRDGDPGDFPHRNQRRAGGGNGALRPARRALPAAGRAGTLAPARGVPSARARGRAGEDFRVSRAPVPVAGRRRGSGSGGSLGPAVP